MGIEPYLALAEREKGERGGMSVAVAERGERGVRMSEKVKIIIK